MITIAILRTAGIPQKLINRVCELEEAQRLAEKAARLDKRRELTKLRVQKHRERVTHVAQRNALQALQGKPEADQTPRHGDERYIGHIDKTPTFPSVIDRPLSAAARAKRKTSLPADWRPTVAAEDEGELERFKRYCKANGKTYVDWDAAWGNWRTSPYRGGQQNGTGRQKGDRSHSISAAFDDIFAKLQGSDGASVVPFEANPRLLSHRRRE